MIEIRRASYSDAAALTALGKRTFIETFAQYNTSEDMEMYVAETFRPDLQLREIQDPTRRIEMAWSDGEACGFLHLKESDPQAVEWGPRPIELLRLYVDSSWHGKGVGAALMDRSIQIARDEGFQTLWLGVWERNFRAQAFYSKYGFAVLGTHEFRLGMDDQIDLIMARAV